MTRRWNGRRGHQGRGGKGDPLGAPDGGESRGCVVVVVIGILNRERRIRGSSGGFLFFVCGGSAPLQGESG
jgi:hypothetical protein